MQHDVHERLQRPSTVEEPAVKSIRHSRPLLPPGTAKRLLPVAAAATAPPTPPPRPEHTLTADSRPVVIPPSPLVVVTLPQQQLRPLQNTAVSLTAPRPEPDREKNVYTEAPLLKRPPQQSQSPVISSQPSTTAAASNKKKAVSGRHVSDLKKPSSAFLSGLRPSDDIFCEACGKCRCEACCQPRRLPQKWLCGGTCLCSKNTVVDAVSCMWCVNGLFYHCSKDSEELVEAGDDSPCTSGGGRHSASRWLAMTALLPLLPCLLTYPLLRGCAEGAEAVYAKCTASGCQCQKSEAIRSSRPLLPDKGLIPKA